MVSSKKTLRVLYLAGPRTYTRQKWQLLQMGLGKKAPFDAAMALMNKESMKVDFIELHSWNLASWIAQAAKSSVYIKRYDAVFTCGLFLTPLRVLLRWNTPKLFVLIERIRTNTYSDYLLLPFMRFCVKYVDKVICLSSLQPQNHALELNMPLTKVIDIQYAIDSKFFFPQETHSNGIILCVGDAYRDNKILIEATKDLPVKVIRVSDNQKTLKNFVMQVPKKLLSKKYITLCNVSEFQLKRLYELAAVVVVPILQNSNQPAGLTSILEAMAMGKPLIVTQGLSSIDYVTNGKTGIVIDSGNVKQLRSAIMNLISDPSTSKKLGDMGRTAVEQYFTIEHLMLRLRTEIQSMFS
jgi:glycosyltransferase involved in cell wall biosynthesis